MRIELPRPGEPRRPHGPRNPGDAWVVAPSGERYWGRYGAAGLLALDPGRGVLLQHRAAWSHFGDTWGLPGGARHKGEPAIAAAMREAAEEAGVPTDAMRPRLTSVLDLGFWSYTTIVADAVRPFDPAITDAESRELAWVLVGEVDERPLHPGFATSWRRLRPLLVTRPAVVVDAANVVGSVPDGWWKDRVGAARRLLANLDRLADTGVPAGLLDLPEDAWFPDWVVVVEGRARAVDDGARALVVRADGSGDDRIVAEVHRLAGAGATVTVVTSDRGLAERVSSAGANVVGARWLVELMTAR